MVRIGELPSGDQDRVDWGQEGQRKRKEKNLFFLKSALVLSRHIIADIFHRSKNIKKPWFYTSRRLVIWKTVFRIPDPNPLLYSKEREVSRSIKMSVVELKNLSSDDLKKRLAQQIYINDWTDKCGKCGYPKLIKDHLMIGWVKHGTYLLNYGPITVKD